MFRASFIQPQLSSLRSGKFCSLRDLFVHENSQTLLSSNDNKEAVYALIISAGRGRRQLSQPPDLRSPDTSNRWFIAEARSLVAEISQLEVAASWQLAQLMSGGQVVQATGCLPTAARAPSV